MLIIVSPAKTLDFESPIKSSEFSQPDFLKESRKLIKELKDLSAEDISSLMHVSQKIGELNFFRYLNFKTPFTADNARQALFAFKGDVYTGIDSDSYKAGDIKFAQKHLRILSGLYGLLKPMDLMQAYRLEMGTKFANSEGKDLYAFWGDKLSKALNTALNEQKDKVLINLASNEYYKAVNPKALDAQVITPVFKDYKNGQYKIISFYAKKARGLMTSYIIKNRLKKVSELEAFDCEGYRFDAIQSTESKLVFLRKQDGQ